MPVSASIFVSWYSVLAGFLLKPRGTPLFFWRCPLKNDRPIFCFGGSLSRFSLQPSPTEARTSGTGMGGLGSGRIDGLGP